MFHVERENRSAFPVLRLSGPRASSLESGELSSAIMFHVEHSLVIGLGHLEMCPELAPEPLAPHDVAGFPVPLWLLLPLGCNLSEHH